MFVSVLCIASIASPAFAADAAAAAPAAGADPSKCGADDFLKSIYGSESGGNYAETHNGNYLGAFAVGEPKLVDLGLAVKDGHSGNNTITWSKKANDLGIFTNQDFLNNKELQNQTIIGVKGLDWKYLSNSAQNSVGSTMSNGAIVTESGLLKGAQFGSGKVNAYVANGFKCIDGGKGVETATNDGNGICVQNFMTSGAGYDVSSITGTGKGSNGQCGMTAASSTPYSGDTTSRTCPPTVAMLQAIPCLSYPMSLVPFCLKYKPIQMNMSECQAAEKYAQSAPPSGPQLDACKAQTFGGTGTGSWSYVLACAKASPAQGEPGEAKKSLGAADDPACYERLKGKGMQIEEKGKMDISTGGRTCIIPNATGWSGGTIPLSQKVTLNCALVEQLEEFSKAAVGMGISRMEVLGTLSCRGINNTKGTGQSKTSLHGFGNAIDINGFTINGASVPTSRYFTNAASRAFFDGMIQLGCSKFDGTLAFRFYKKKWTHVHWQATEKTNCDPNG
jgi:hypothetical protein